MQLPNHILKFDWWCPIDVQKGFGIIIFILGTNQELENIFPTSSPSIRTVACVFYSWFRKHMSKAQILKDILIKGEDGGRLTRLPIHSATLQCIILLFKIYNQQLGEDATKCDDPSFASTCTIFLSMIHESMTLSIFLSPWETRVLDLIILAELELSSSFLLHCRC